MDAVTQTPKPRAGRPLDVVVALIAHCAVGAAWGVAAMTVMGLLSIPRRMLINSEWAFDMGRLPDPWVLLLALPAIGLAHLFFGWAMRRVGGGQAAYGPSVVAWAGALLGVAWGAFNWAPPVTVGVQVGPKSGQSTPWDPLTWVAYYGRLWVPALVGLVTLALVLFSRQSPLRWFLNFLDAARLRRRERRIARKASQAKPATA